jgi:hypothetical protein
MPTVKKPKPRKVGRPSIYTPAVAEAVCVFIVDGKSLRQIGEEPGMPAKATIVNWLAKHEDFRVQYARARELQADALIDEILTIADTPLIGERVKKLPNGTKETTTGDMIEHRRLQVEARKWLIAKLAPKKYGDKLDVEHSGEVSIAETMRLAHERLRKFREKQQAEAKAILDAKKPA